MSTQIHHYLTAASDLLKAAVEDARKDDPDGVAGLAAALRAGGLITLRSTFAPSTGLAQLDIAIVEPSGVSHQLMACELQRNEL